MLKNMFDKLKEIEFFKRFQKKLPQTTFKKPLIIKSKKILPFNQWMARFRKKGTNPDIYDLCHRGLQVNNIGKNPFPWRAKRDLK